MSELTRKERARLRRAHRSGDEDVLEEVIEEITEDKLERWVSSKHGAYGLLEECESREGRQRAADLVAEAWQKLRELGDEEIDDAMDEYEEAQGGTPTFDAEGTVVDSEAGGSTRTRWEKIAGGYRQAESGPIYIASKWICRLKRSGSRHVVLAVMKTLLHELMGHWARQGQRVRGTNDAQRRARSERIADRETDNHWEDIRGTERWDDCVSELEAEHESRQPAQEQAIRDAIQEFLNELEQ